MADISIINDGSETRNASALKCILNSLIPTNHPGRILITPSFTCFGSDVGDIDLVVYGQFSANLSVPLSYQPTKQTCTIRSFVFTIEVKAVAPEDINLSFDLSGSIAKVRYNGRWENASTKSEAQKWALRKYLTQIVGWSPFVCNFIWFRNLTRPAMEERLRSQVPPETMPSLHLHHNWLYSDFDLSFMFQLACLQLQKWKKQDIFTGTPVFFNSNYSHSPDEAADRITKAYEHFAKGILTSIGKLTRETLERITKQAILKDQQYVQAIGKKLVIIRGRAGTGKTIKLVHIAYDLCKKRHERCLVLTYNKALVSDLCRTITLAQVKNDMDEGSVDVSTIHAFMRKLFIAFKLFSPENDNFSLDYDNLRYENLKRELLSCLVAGAITPKDIQDLKRQDAKLDWDKLLIDEGQDWPTDERDILYHVFESRNFIVADGVDQLVRGGDRTDWTRFLTKDIPFQRPTAEKRSMRQKANLCRFENEFARLVHLTWDIEPKDEFVGGKVIVSTKPYSLDLHKRLAEINEKDGNKPYEMLFLVPPDLVVKESGKSQGFRDAEIWENWGISLWDGTLEKLRSDYPHEVSQHRLLQYQSCRGLEGWIVVCLWFDDFIERKMSEFVKSHHKATDELFSMDSKEEFAYKWALIAFTRAVDTLVITVRDPKSAAAALLRQLHKMVPDYIEWID